MTARSFVSRRFAISVVVVAIASFALSSIAIPGGSPTRAQSQGSYEQLRELAERLLAPPSFGGPESTVRLLPGEISVGVPVPLPPPPGGRVVGSAVFGFDDTTTSIQVVMDSPRSPGDVVAFYDAALAARGWQPFDQGFFGPGGGFQPTPQVVSRFYCPPEGERGSSLFLTAGAPATGATDIRANFDVLFGGPCSQQGLPPVPPPFVDAIPALFAPAGVELIVSFAGCCTPDVASEAVAVTDMSNEELEAHFAGQLEDAGWTRTGGGVDDELAWSVWTPDNEGGPWRGILYVAAGPEPGQHQLHVRATSAEIVNGGGFGPFELGASGAYGGFQPTE